MGAAVGGKLHDGVLELLKHELSFLRNSGYRHPDHAQWRAQYIFEDSPTCLNFGHGERSRPCSYCPLFAFVPADAHQKRRACRYIPLNDTRETLDSLYRSASPQEIETIVAAWLEKQIARLEQEQAKEVGT